MDNTIRVIYIIDPRGSFVDCWEWNCFNPAINDRKILNAKAAGYVVVEYFVPEHLGLHFSVPFSL